MLPLFPGYLALGNSMRIYMDSTSGVYHIQQNSAGAGIEDNTGWTDIATIDPVNGILATASGAVLQAGGTFNLQGAATQTTAPAAGGAAALPATPAGYVTIEIGGTAHKVAYY